MSTDVDPSNPPVLLYDGVCGVCNGAVRTILRFDRRGTLRFAALDSDYARDAMIVFRQTIDDFVDRMVYAPQAVVLRARISPAGEILARLDAGTVLLIEDERENWLHVRNPSSKESGWLPRSQIRYIDN